MQKSPFFIRKKAFYRCKSVEIYQKIKCSDLTEAFELDLPKTPGNIDLCLSENAKPQTKKTGKVYIKHSLIQAVRTERGLRQRIVLTLGRLSVDRIYWKDLATHQRSTVVWTNKKKEIWGKRISGIPEMRHLQIYKKLGVNNPLKNQPIKM